MYRRHLLAGLGAGVGGCLGAPVARQESDGSVTVASMGSPPNICETEIDAGEIPAIVDPAFGAGWDGVDVPKEYLVNGRGLTDDSTVIGLARKGEARAYPLAVLRMHEVVNDALDVPVLVTHCSVCRSGLTAVRRVGGRETTFGVTGELWQPPDGSTGAAFGAAADVENATGFRAINAPNLVMFDTATRSYWSQLLARAICGPLTGEFLDLVPSTFATLGAWQEAHPETSVLLPPPHSKTL